MSNFLQGGELSDKIREVAKGDDLRIAVAFIGAGLDKTLKPDIFKTTAKIICDIGMGSTNPQELEKLMAADKTIELRYRENFHAKVYISSKGAVVGSANASENGLGSISPSGGAKLLEAGVFLDVGSSAYVEASDWFNKLWKSVEKNEVNDAVIKKVTEAWSRPRSGQGILGYTHAGEDKRSLLKNIIERPEIFSKKFIGIVCSDGGNDPDVEADIRDEWKHKYPNIDVEDLEIYTEWSENTIFPDMFVSIHRVGANKYTFNRFKLCCKIKTKHGMSFFVEEILPKKMNGQFKELETFLEKNSLKIKCEILEEVYKKSDNFNEAYFPKNIGEFGDKLLKVMNS